MKVTISNRQRKIKLSIRQLEKDSLKALRFLGLQRAELSILLASAEKVRTLNSTYRGADRTTDVLSFPLYDSATDFPENTDFLLGDVVINPSLAEGQAAEQGTTLKQELRRLLVHGLLHLLGYDHEKSSYFKRKMRKKEKELLGKLA
jgi:probable rRNA maturation factor